MLLRRLFGYSTGLDTGETSSHQAPNMFGLSFRMYINGMWIAIARDSGLRGLIFPSEIYNFIEQPITIIASL